ncbi:chemotaxis protein CheA [Aquabacterium sp. OR-4]|uniref:chemotaxis protein CheA n=1 Tax=Aquabacterium sp. OR-4 TaxID=2978127 RepID=UPI0028C9E39A|nr:chemotaxis protein CheA [Aquabacterium sp. OR-4]MDT7835969.1 chemotaxis protein CheA [Aquabacterium sp. OR-4]
MSSTELLDQFILEARECLEQIGQRLLDVEKNPGDRELLNDLFRQVHTLKGNCGLFDFKPLERVVHAGEDLLDRVRNGSLAYSGDIADALLAAMDYTAELVDLIATEGSLPATTEGRAQELATALRRHLAGPAPAAAASPGTAPAAAASPGTAAAPATAPAAAPALPDWLAALPATACVAGHTALRYLPDADCFFKGEDPWHLARSTPGLQHLQVRAAGDWGSVADFDCYRCNLELVVVSDAPRAYIEEHYRYVPDQLSWHALEAAATATATAAAPDSASTGAADPAAPGPDTAADGDPLRELLRARIARIWDDQRALLARPGIAAGTVAATRRTLAALIDGWDDAALAASLRATLEALPAGAAPLAQWALQHRPGAAAACDTTAAGGGAPTAAAPGASALVAPLEPRRGSSGGAGDDSASGGGQKVLKVAQDKIDRLMDLIGEMVVAKNALPYLANRAETVFNQRELAREIKTQYSVINRIAEDMQHAIMQVRMLPVGTVFQRFGRLVRDISKKLGKEVNLVIEGEDTEADKNVIESLADPLIHILRNSLDHGIELPAARMAAGKPAAGTLRVAARQEGDRVILDITDDGAGIDTDRVRAKAVERGLIPADRACLLSEHEAVQLVFLPGFSTAEAISDLSGRGVGMDVVRSAVERINGSVELASTRGKGTQIRLALPLSMAVTNVMMIETAGRRFGVPMDLIVETVRVPAEDIHHFKSAQTVVLRGRIVPLRALNELLALDMPPRQNGDGEHAVLVVRLGSENLGLLVDDFHGTSDIILKPLEGVLTGITGFAGTALMGDGSVLMILNPKELS